MMRFTHWRAGGRVAGGVGLLLLINGAIAPVKAQTFQDQLDTVVCVSFPYACVLGPPSAGPGGQFSVHSQDTSGTAARDVERRLERRRCKDGEDADCLPQEAASADEMSFEGFSVFASAGYSSRDKAENPFEPGFDADEAMGTVGLDYAIGTDGVAGLAFSYIHTDGEFDGGGGDFEADSYGGFLYGSYYPTDQSFIDASIGYAFKDIFTSRTTVILGIPQPGPNGPAREFGDTTGHEFSARVSGGYDFTFDALTIGPRAGINYVRTETDGYTEDTTDVDGDPPICCIFAYEDQVETSLTAELGFDASYAISTDFGVIVPQVSARYVHEFEKDQKLVTTSAADPPFPTISYLTEEPDRDYAIIGAGIVVVLPNGLSTFVSYQGQVANEIEAVHSISLGLRFELW